MKYLRKPGDPHPLPSPSARREWIEIDAEFDAMRAKLRVSLREEGVD